MSDPHEGASKHGPDFFDPNERLRGLIGIVLMSHMVVHNNSLDGHNEPFAANLVVVDLEGHVVVDIGKLKHIASSVKSIAGSLLHGDEIEWGDELSSTAEDLIALLTTKEPTT